MVTPPSAGFFILYTIKAGASEQAAVCEVKLPEYADIPRYADWLSHNVRAIYRYLHN
jgi:hypothetical protein